MALSTRYQTTTPYEGLATWVAAMLSPTTLSGGGGEGLYWGGVGSVDNGYPAFLALVKDDTGRIWPCGSSVATTIEFADSEGECSLYLIPFDKVSVPTYVATRIGSFSVVAQLTASAAPASSLLLGAGTVASGAFTSFTEATGVRRDSLGVGSGADGDIVLLARNGDANLPGLRYHAASGAWQYSNNGTSWHAMSGTASGLASEVANDSSVSGATVKDALETLGTDVGVAVPSSEKGAANGVASLDANGAVPIGQLPIGNTSQTVCVGDDPRLSDERDPKTHAADHAPGGDDPIGTATPAASAIPIADAGGTLDSWVTDASTSAKGKVQLATSVQITAGLAVQASDTRLTDTRDPKPHHTDHQHGGADEIATATPAANAIPKAGGSGKLDGWVTDASTSAKGKVQLATDGGSTAGTAVQASDTRLNADRVTGPGSSANGNLASFNGTGGKTLQDSGKAAASVVTGPGSAVSTDLAILDATGRVISDSGVLLADVARLGTAQTFTARKTCTNGLLAMVRDTKYGYPTTGAHVAGDLWLDAAGALWYCTADGTGGTWVQVSVGIADTWSGAGSTDITKVGTGGNWNGDPSAPRDGYRVIEPAYGGIWTYSATWSRWLGRRCQLTIAHGIAAYSSTTTGPQVMLSDDYDYLLVEHSLLYMAATGTDPSNFWYVQLRKGSPTLGAYGGWANTLTIQAVGQNGQRAAAASGAEIHVTSTHGIMYLNLVKNNTPGNLTLFGGTVLMREVRKAT